MQQSQFFELKEMGHEAVLGAVNKQPSPLRSQFLHIQSPEEVGSLLLKYI